MVTVDITDGDKVLLRASLIVRLLSDPATRADESNVELAVGGLAWFANRELWKHRARSDSGCGAEKSSSFHRTTLWLLLDVSSMYWILPKILPAAVSLVDLVKEPFFTGIFGSIVYLRRMKSPELDLCAFVPLICEAWDSIPLGQF